MVHEQARPIRRCQRCGMMIKWSAKDPNWQHVNADGDWVTSPLPAHYGEPPAADAEVTFHTPPSTDHGTGDATGRLVDTPESREALEQNAIPGCWTWRKANREPCWCRRGHVLAPYCCSAYCTRCAGLRALDGVPPLTPNQWMENPDG